jgi:hypothetical protein
MACPNLHTLCRLTLYKLKSWDKNIFNNFHCQPYVLTRMCMLSFFMQHLWCCNWFPDLLHLEVSLRSQRWDISHIFPFVTSNSLFQVLRCSFMDMLCLDWGVRRCAVFIREKCLSSRYFCSSSHCFPALLRQLFVPVCYVFCVAHSVSVTCSGLFWSFFHSTIYAT